MNIRFSVYRQYIYIYVHDTIRYVYINIYHKMSFSSISILKRFFSESCHGKNSSKNPRVTCEITVVQAGFGGLDLASQYNFMIKNTKQ